jgi:hypothetical protein
MAVMHAEWLDTHDEEVRIRTLDVRQSYCSGNLFSTHISPGLNVAQMRALRNHVDYLATQIQVRLPSVLRRL